MIWDKQPYGFLSHLPDNVYYFAYGFAAFAHAGQKRKYNYEPYINHCMRVADTVRYYLPDDAHAVVAAILHDTLEDTITTHDQITTYFGPEVLARVMEVTNVSQDSDGNRARRKRIDLDHLARASVPGEIIKLADILDNVVGLAANDHKFARVYLPEKLQQLEVLRHGPPSLIAQVGEAIHIEQKYLKARDEDS